MTNLTRRERRRLARDRLRLTWREEPYRTAYSVTMIPIGVLAIIFGSEVSAALGNLAAGLIPRGMGLLMVIGGAVYLHGVTTDRAQPRAVGLACMAFGFFIYGVGVLLGLGLQGAVAGGLAVAGFVATVQSIRVLLARARVVSNGTTR